jgi:long-chain fatty acid transport protein
LRVPRLSYSVLMVCACGVVTERSAQAQTNIEINQGIQIDFLNPGTRSLAMGGAFVGLANDATAALANPAGLHDLSKTEVCGNIFSASAVVRF